MGGHICQPIFMFILSSYLKKFNEILLTKGIYTKFDRRVSFRPVTAHNDPYFT